MPCAGQGSSSSCWPCDQPRLHDILRDRLHSHQAPSLQSFSLSLCLAAFQYESSIAGFPQLFLRKIPFSTPSHKAPSGPPGTQTHQLRRYKQHSRIRAVCQLEPYLCQVPNSPLRHPPPPPSAACPACTTPMLKNNSSTGTHQPFCAHPMSPPPLHCRGTPVCTQSRVTWGQTFFPVGWAATGTVSCVSPSTLLQAATAGTGRQPPIPAPHF